jgi:hypothetical protein
MATFNIIGLTGIAIAMLFGLITMIAFKKKNKRRMVLSGSITAIITVSPYVFYFFFM